MYKGILIEMFEKADANGDGSISREDKLNTEGREGLVRGPVYFRSLFPQLTNVIINYMQLMLIFWHTFRSKKSC